jgi:hypothetical protein
MSTDFALAILPNGQTAIQCMVCATDPAREGCKYCGGTGKLRPGWSPEQQWDDLVNQWGEGHFGPVAPAVFGVLVAGGKIAAVERPEPEPAPEPEPLPPPPDPRPAPPQNAPHRSTCKCGQEVLWVVSASTGKDLPLDPTPVANGNLMRVGTTATVRYIGPGDSPKYKYVSHFATCKHAAEFRRDK